MKQAVAENKELDGSMKPTNFKTIESYTVAGIEEPPCILAEATPAIGNNNLVTNNDTMESTKERILDLQIEMMNAEAPRSAK